MINDLPLEIIEHVISFLTLKEKSKMRMICILWDNIISKWNIEIKKEMHRHIIKYVQMGDISMFEHIPLVAQYYLLDWAIQFKQKDIIFYAIKNGYDHFYCQDNVCNIITYIKESPVLANYFIPTKKSKIGLLTNIINQGNLDHIQFLLNSLDNICLKMPKYDCRCCSFLQKLFYCQKNVINFVLNYMFRFYSFCPDFIPQIIYHTASRGFTDLMENYLPLNDECYEQMINGIVDSFNDKIYDWYTKKYGKIRFSKYHRSKLNIKEIHCKNHSFIFFVLDKIHLNKKDMSVLYANIVHYNGQNHELIELITDYVIRNYCLKRPFESFIKDRYGIVFSIKLLNLISIKYLLSHGYKISEYDIKGFITNNRIDVLSYLKSINYHGLEIIIDNIISYETFMQKIPNYHTFIWMHHNTTISKTINISQFVCYFIVDEKDIVYLNFIHQEGYPFESNLYEDLIERCVNRKIKDTLAILIFDFLYNNKIMFHYEKILSIIRYNHIYLSAIILKWFIKHGIEMAEYMTQTDDTIKIKWLVKHGCPVFGEKKLKY